ncbi:MAG TPA: IPT/TIG domain-containing protein [Blastocatellia bacterium]
MKSDRRPTSLLACLLLLSLVAAQASDRRTTISKARSVSLPSSAVLDERAQPLIAASGKVGFVTSVTGSLISFSLTSGKVLSSVSVGESLGSASMMEVSGHRLIAAPAGNDPTHGNPATVSIIDATSAKRLEVKSLLVLPPDALITPATDAMLTQDGRFCLIASSFDSPTLYCFEIETGRLASQLKLEGRPSEAMLYSDEARTLVAIASADKNILSVVNMDGQGELAAVTSFSPSSARFDETNNPAFSVDGRIVYIGASKGDRLFALDSGSGIIIDSIAVSSPEHISVANAPDGIDLIAATRLRKPSGERGGVSILAYQEGRLRTRSEFTPPEGIDFSRANNVAFTADGTTGFVGSTTGMLFAFNTATGELESFQDVGSELRRIALSVKSRSVAAVRAATSGDEVTIINFDLVDSAETNPSAPSIESLSHEVVEQGRLKNLRLQVSGKNFTDATSVLVNGIETAAELSPRTGALEINLPKALFNEVGSLSLQVKGADGTLSVAKELRVVRPDAPVIERISPAEVPGPSGPFTLKVIGKNFRASSTVVIADQPLNTQHIGSTSLQVTVPADIAGAVTDGLKVQIKDLSVPDLVSSNEKELRVSGPRVTELRTTRSNVIAGSRDFSLTIIGDNFRHGAAVDLKLNGDVFTAVHVQRTGSKIITLRVPSNAIQESGQLAVVVRNPGGAQSEPRELEIHGPEITGFTPGEILAGSSDVAIDIVGRSFRRRSRVYAGNARIEQKRVRFVNTRHLVVTFTGEMNRLLEKPDELRFEVVNPNAGDGVASSNKGLSVVGPEITNASVQPCKDDSSRVYVVIDGANFHRGATVEFFKFGMENAPVGKESPATITKNRLKVLASARKLEGMGSFQVRVVNPGTSPVPSNLFRPRQIEVAGNNQ